MNKKELKTIERSAQKRIKEIQDEADIGKIRLAVQAIVNYDKLRKKTKDKMLIRLYESKMEEIREYLKEKFNV